MKTLSGDRKTIQNTFAKDANPVVAVYLVFGGDRVDDVEGHDTHKQQHKSHHGAAPGTKGPDLEGETNGQEPLHLSSCTHKTH